MATVKLQQDMIYKGCTRPPLLWGVPLLPLIMVLMPGMLVGMVGLAYFLPMSLVAIFVSLTAWIWMRAVTKKDDQRLLQIFLRLRLRSRQKNTRYWGCAAYAPIVYFRRKLHASSNNG
jgi:type IV secretion system protein VirB3